MKSIVLDFETYFNTRGDYSLKKMTTEAYVRDERFAAIALGYSYNGTTSAVGATHIKAFLDDFDWSNLAVLCHHAAFDGLILSHHYNVRPKAFLCTMSMARAWWPQHGASLEALARRLNLPDKDVPYDKFDGVHPEYLNPHLLELIGQGASHDCNLTLAVLNRLMMDGFPEMELPIIDMTVQMFTNPKLIGNVTKLLALERSEIDERDRTVAEMQISKEQLRSNDKFAALLEEQGVLIEYKKGTKGLIPCFASTDQFMKDLQDDQNPAAAALATARMQVKSNIRETRAARLAASAANGPLPVYLNYFGATRTGRWSGGDRTNWQNFPRSGELGRCIRAPEGHQLIIADAAQIECRILNYVAGQEDVINAFRGGRDIYCELASVIYRRTISREDTFERFIGKKTELSCGYGIGSKRLHAVIKHDSKDVAFAAKEDISNAERCVKRYVQIYRGLHPHVVHLWEEGNKILAILKERTSCEWLNGIVRVDRGTIVLPNGTKLHYELEFDKASQSYQRTDRRGTSKIWGGALVGEIVQALASVYLREVIANIASRTGAKPVCLRHDEAVYVVRDCDVELSMKQFKEEFCRAPAWLPDIPLDCEIWSSTDYGGNK